MSEKIRMDGKYKTASGLDVKILCVDVVGKYPVVAIISSGEDSSPYSFDVCGNYLGGGKKHCLDLVPDVESIPEDVCFNSCSRNFHRMSDRRCLLRPEHHRMGETFDYDKWLPRVAEFPTYESVFGNMLNKIEMEEMKR